MYSCLALLLIIELCKYDGTDNINIRRYILSAFVKKEYPLWSIVEKLFSLRHYE